ncbi:MAG: response regulator transcription factor [Hyphomicrobiales bacterium]
MKPTVYIVEDDEANRSSLREVLEIYGYSVVTFATGEDFLDRAEMSGRGCVILDVNLPGASGLEVLQRLRSRQVSIPAVIVSGRATADMRAQASRLEALAFFEKPIDIDELVVLIDSAN